LRHLRIVCAVLLVGEVVSGFAYLLAFMFSWESLSRHNDLLSVPVLGVGVFLQLMVVLPQRRKGLLLLVGGAVLAVLALMVGTSWQKNKRVGSQLYMSALFPPGWRMAGTVPVETLMGEAKVLEQRLDERLKDQSDDADAADPEEADQ
jgi:hypothetical protein